MIMYSPLIYYNLFYNLTVYSYCAASSVGLVRVNMHGQGIAVTYPHNHIAENQAPAVSIHLNGHDLAIVYPKSLGICLGGMDMALRRDHALGNLNLALRPNQLTGSTAFQIAGFPDGGGNADGTGIRQR